jgi:hypothetical protein
VMNPTGKQIDLFRVEYGAVNQIENISANE